MELGEAVIVAGIGSRKGVSAVEVVAAVDAALKEHGLERAQLAALATTEFKRGEVGIFEAGEMMGLEVMVVEIPPPLAPLAHGVAAASEKVDPHSGLLRKPPAPRSTGERKRAFVSALPHPRRSGERCRAQ
jgi:cobalamin biosynthesis protein CbiG